VPTLSYNPQDLPLGSLDVRSANTIIDKALAGYFYLNIPLNIPKRFDSLLNIYELPSVVDALNLVLELQI
jgi:hypothetical protein